MKNNPNEYPDPSELITRNVVSSTDLTGMIPSLLNNESEMDAYTEIHNIPEQGDINDLKDEIQKELND